MTLEELLNKLIEKGWKPRWNKVLNWLDIVNNKRDIKYKWKDTIAIQCYDKNDKYLWTSFKKLRELVSRDSWLWQFVCENKMVKKLWDNFKYFYNSRDNKSTLRYYEDRYKYWLLESALCDEDKLEQFLLDNIKIEW